MPGLFIAPQPGVKPGGLGGEEERQRRMKRRGEQQLYNVNITLNEKKES